MMHDDLSNTTNSPNTSPGLNIGWPTALQGLLRVSPKGVANLRTWRPYAPINSTQATETLLRVACKYESHNFIRQEEKRSAKGNTRCKSNEWCMKTWAILQTARTLVLGRTSAGLQPIQGLLRVSPKGVPNLRAWHPYAPIYSTRATETLLRVACKYESHNLPLLRPDLHALNIRGVLCVSIQEETHRPVSLAWRHRHVACLTNGSHSRGLLRTYVESDCMHVRYDMLA